MRLGVTKRFGIHPAARIDARAEPKITRRTPRPQWVEDPGQLRVPPYGRSEGLPWMPPPCAESRLSNKHGKLRRCRNWPNDAESTRAPQRASCPRCIQSVGHRPEPKLRISQRDGAGAHRARSLRPNYQVMPVALTSPRHAQIVLDPRCGSETPVCLCGPRPRGRPHLLLERPHQNAGALSDVGFQPLTPGHDRGGGRRMPPAAEVRRAVATFRMRASVG